MPIEPNITAIPVELKIRFQWVAWRHPDKVPINPQTYGNAKVNDPATWGTFEDAYKAYVERGYGGVGYVFKKSDPYIGVDLDKCRNPETGELDVWAVDIVKRLHSYTEVSPSGRGLHILVKGSVPAGINANGIEIYDDGRFFTVTGHHMEDTPITIEDRQQELRALYDETKATPSGKNALSDTKLIPIGQRNNKLTSLAGSMRQKGMSREAIEAALLQENALRCDPPLSLSEVNKIAASVAQYEPGQSMQNLPCTDLGNAQRLVARHGRDLRYVHIWKKWLVWNGSRWAIDNDGEIERRAKETVRHMGAEATAISDDSFRKTLLRWALSSESAERIRKMISLAESE